MAEGDDSGELGTWRTLLDAQVRLEEQRSSLRASAIGGFVAVVLGSVLVRRFVFMTEPERWLLVAAPGAVMIAAGLLDHVVLGARVRRLAELATELDADSTAARVRAEAVSPPRDGWALLAFYGVPAVLALGLAVWGLL